jgi:pyruvate/2-oxoglutarate dehydrogenase complex dihydrolipoamide acyltransferase (E2) component
VSNDKPEVTDPELAAAEQAYIENERKLSAEVHAKSAGFKPPGRVIVPEVNKTAVQPAPTPPKQQAPEPAPQPIAPALTATPNAAQAPMTNNVQNANLKELSQSGNDLSVASVQKLANRNSENIRQISPNEVEIDFHSR